MSDKTSTECRYRVAYAIEEIEGDGLTKAEMQAHPKYGPGKWGGTDKFIIALILESEGGRSTQIHSRQYDGSELPAIEIYELVVLLCRKLAMEGELGGIKEQNCWTFFNAQLALMGLPPQDLEHARELFGSGGPITAHRKPTED